jgi:hypothetical protein
MPRFVRSLTCAGLLFSPALTAESLQIQIASPVAAQMYQMKRSAFVFRTSGCPPEAKPEFSATAEGKVDGQRRSLVLKVVTGSPPNVFGIFREWPAQGVWVVNLKARCASQTAGALVATDAAGLVRESSSILDHHATEADIQAALERGKKIDTRND